MIHDKFVVHNNRKRYIMIKMGDGWNSQRNRLYHIMDKDGMIPLGKLIKNVPDNIRLNDWASFVQYRRSQKGQVNFLIIINFLIINIFLIILMFHIFCRLFLRGTPGGKCSRGSVTQQDRNHLLSLIAS